MESLNTAYFTPAYTDTDSYYIPRHYTYALFSEFNNSQLFSISFITKARQLNECIIVFTNLCARETMYVKINDINYALAPRASLSHREELNTTQEIHEYPILVAESIARTHLFESAVFRPSDEIRPQKPIVSSAIIEEAFGREFAAGVRSHGYFGAIAQANRHIGKKITSGNVRVRDVVAESVFDNPRSCGMAHNVPRRYRRSASKLRYSNTNPYEEPLVQLVSFVLTAQ